MPGATTMASFAEAVTRDFKTGAKSSTRAKPVVTSSDEEDHPRLIWRARNGSDFGSKIVDEVPDCSTTIDRLASLVSDCGSVSSHGKVEKTPAPGAFGLESKERPSHRLVDFGQKALFDLGRSNSACVVITPRKRVGERFRSQIRPQRRGPSASKKFERRCGCRPVGRLRSAWLPYSKRQSRFPSVAGLLVRADKNRLPTWSEAPFPQRSSRIVAELQGWLPGRHHVRERWNNLLARGDFLKFETWSDCCPQSGLNDVGATYSLFIKRSDTPQRLSAKTATGIDYRWSALNVTR